MLPYVLPGGLRYEMSCDISDFEKHECPKGRGFESSNARFKMKGALRNQGSFSFSEKRIKSDEILYYLRQYYDKILENLY